MRLFPGGLEGDEIWRDRTAVVHWVLGLFAGVWLPFQIWSGRRTRS